MSKLIGNLDRGFIIVISAPAGTGKTTLVQKLTEEFPNEITRSISCTTRPPRKGEIDGKDYVFLTKKAFDKRKAAGDFLECATVFGYEYGTLKDVVQKQCESGKHVVLVIDTQGALALKEKVKACFIFIAPPSHEELKNRLEKRQTESKEVMDKRLSWAEKEIEQVKHYDYQIINDNLETAYRVLKGIISAEEHKL